MKVSINKAKNWIRHHVGVILIVALVLGVGCYIYTIFYPNPFKVIDPNSPLFNPMKYEGRDYRNHPDMRDAAIKKAMPQGTPLATVQTIMKNNDACFGNGAYEKDTPGMYHFVCTTSLKHLKGANYIFWFDENHMLIDYFGNGSKGIYTRKFPDEVRQEILRGHE